MRDIDTKYHTTGDIIRKEDNTMLPADEPLMLFRGRDRLLPQVLDFYLGLREKAGSKKNRIELLKAEIDKIKQWQKDHPSKLRTPH